MHRATGLTGTLLATAIGAGLASTGHAADKGFYAGVSAGHSKADIKESDTNEAILFAFESQGLTVLNAESDLDKSDTGFGALVGYRFGPYFALEGAYYDLGKAAFDAEGAVLVPGVGVVPATAHLTAGAKGPALSVLGSLPLSAQWELYGKAGVFFSDTTIKTRITLDTESGTDNTSKKSEDLLAAVGAAFRVGDRWTFRLEYQRFFDVGDKDTTGESDIDFVNLAALIKF